ncbi:MAG: hypothetical protein JKY45_06175 [Emcibacter sp.]|nr:hypothetical protein [Emcibacter sp.]
MAFFRRNKKIKDAAYDLFTKIVEQARSPEFYANWHVADTLDGRFDLIILHVGLVINRLEASGENKEVTLLIRYLQEVLFDNMDMSLRELGVGDMSVGKKVKVMAEAYYGRMAVYRRAIHSEDRENKLKSSLIRNIYRDDAPEDAIIGCFVTYVSKQVKCLEGQATEDLMLAKLIFIKVS